MAEPVPIPERPEREPVFTIASVVLLLIAACCVIHLVRNWLLSEDADISLLVHWAFIPLRYWTEYALDLSGFVSPMSYSLLHGDGMHLAINMIWLAAFGSPLAHRIGGWRFVGFWLLTAIGAAATHFLVRPFDGVPLIGASGAISGMMAAAARFGFSVDRRSRQPAFAGPRLGMGQMATRRNTAVFLGVWFAINLIAGLGWLTPAGSAEIAWEAHIGGFLTGLFGIAVFDRPGQAPR